MTARAWLCTPPLSRLTPIGACALGTAPLPDRQRWNPYALPKKRIELLLVACSHSSIGKGSHFSRTSLDSQAIKLDSQATSEVRV